MRYNSSYSGPNRKFKLITWGVVIQEFCLLINGLRKERTTFISESLNYEIIEISKITKMMKIFKIVMTIIMINTNEIINNLGLS